MAGPQHKSFPHRHNHDGSTDSICPSCFRTIARTRCETELVALESAHECDAESLAAFSLAPAATKVSIQSAKS